MGKNKGYIIRIEAPCHESWEAMDARGAARFCSSCQKNVQDFTRLSEAGLWKLAAGHSGPICGRFLNSQLDRPLKLAAPQRSRSLFKMLAAFFTVTSLSSLLSVQAQKTRNLTTRLAQEQAAFNKTMKKDSSLQWLSGRVYDGIGGVPLADASILVEGKVVAVTDTTGSYRFVLSVVSNSAVVHVVAEKKSHKPQTKWVRLKHLPAQLDFTLKSRGEEEVIVTMGMVTVLPVKGAGKSGHAEAKKGKQASSELRF